MKGPSVLQNISQGMSSLGRGVGRDKQSLLKLNKGTLVYSPAEGQVPLNKPLSMIIIIKAGQRNSFQHGVRIGFLPATFAITRIVACHAPLSIGLSQQEYWSGCHFLFQGIFLTQGSNQCLWHLLHWQVDS